MWSRSCRSTPPPLLRVYARVGGLHAAVKRAVSGSETEHVALGALRAREAFTYAIGVNGVQTLTHDIGFWPHRCHFKTGCYPPANRGQASVFVSALELTMDADL